MLAEKLLLPAAVGADYAFELWQYNDGQRHIYARRIGTCEAEYFWYLSVEYGSAEEIKKSYLKVVQTVLTNNTRIVQKNGLLWVTFRCDYESESRWKRVSGVSALRSSFTFPTIEGRSKT